MASRRSWGCLLPLVSIVFVTTVSALNNGLGITPPMGWNTWCTQGWCGKDYCWDAEIREIADAMVANGMKDAGYEYINLDDCWIANSRDAQGSLRADPYRFPNGLKPVADYVHSKGLKMGLYTDSGLLTCTAAGPGSYGHYAQDAKTFASWGMDYVKMDWCYTVVDDVQLDPRIAYHNMSIALNNTGRPIFFNLCEQGILSPWEWGPSCGNSWRTGADHHDTWDGIHGVADIIEANVGLSKYAGPGGWNDLDFVMTGGAACWYDWYAICPGMNQTEYITEFSMWSLLSSALLVATDIRPPHFDAFKKSVLLNKEVIAVNQDKLGKQGDRVDLWPCPGDSLGSLTCQVWARPLSDGSQAVVLYNRGNYTHSITVQFSKLGWPASTTATVRDLWLHADVGTFAGSYTASKVLPHGVVMVKVTRK